LTVEIWRFGLPATFSIDYVRAWKRTEEPINQRPEAVEFTFTGQARGAETAYQLEVEGGGRLVV